MDTQMQHHVLPAGAVALAEKIMAQLGFAVSPSREPGADERRDRIVAMIESAVDEAPVIGWISETAGGIRIYPYPEKPSDDMFDWEPLCRSLKTKPGESLLKEIAQLKDQGEKVAGRLREARKAGSSLSDADVDEAAAVLRALGERVLQAGAYAGFASSTDVGSNDPVKLLFPTMLRKMWSGGDVQAWLDALPPLYRQPQPQVPPGWLLVPKTPTPEMVRAAFEGKVETQDLPGQMRRRAAMAENYLAMVNAAPPAPATCVADASGERCAGSFVDETVSIEVVSGVEGRSVYINDYRVAGNKPWGGGTVELKFRASLSDIFESVESAIVKGREPAFSPAIIAALERTDWSMEEALAFYADGKHFDVCTGRTRIVDTGGIAENALDNARGVK
jgi:hypothetical protein